MIVNTQIICVTTFRVIRNNLIFHNIRKNPEYLNDIKNVFSFVDERQLEVKTELFKLIKKDNDNVTRQVVEPSSQIVSGTQNSMVVESSQQMETETSLSSQRTGLSEVIQSTQQSTIIVPESDNNDNEMSEDENLPYIFEESDFKQYLESLTAKLTQELNEEVETFQSFADDYLKLVDDYIASKINEKIISKLVSKYFNSLMNKKNDRIIKYIRRSGIENVNETICDITNDVITNLNSIKNRTVSITNPTTSRIKRITLKSKYIDLHNKVKEYVSNVKFILNNYSNGVLMYIDKLRNYKKDRKKLEKISSDKMKDGIDLFANKKR